MHVQYHNTRKHEPSYTLRLDPVLVCLFFLPPTHTLLIPTFLKVSDMSGRPILIVILFEDFISYVILLPCFSYLFLLSVFRS